MRINRYSFSRKCLNYIVKLHRILEIPVTVNKDAFRLGFERESAVHFYRHGCTLEELDKHAREPGFLAVLSLVH